MLIKAIILLAQTFMTPDTASALDKMTTDYATCAAYYDIKAAYYGIMDPSESAAALGSFATMRYEGSRLERFIGLPEGTFNDRQAAMNKDMVRTASIDEAGFPTLYSVYDGFCDQLKENPADNFARHMPKRKSPMKERRMSDHI